MAYGDAAGFVSYFTSRGKDVSLYDDDEIEAAVLVASEWIDGIYGNSFVGHKTGGFTQQFQWPRISATVKEGNGAFINYYTYPDDVIPDQIKYAAYEAAYRQLVSPGSLLVDYTPSKYKRVSVDGAVSVEYAQFSSASETQTEIAIVDTILWPFMDDYAGGTLSGLSGGSVRV